MPTLGYIPNEQSQDFVYFKRYVFLFFQTLPDQKDNSSTDIARNAKKESRQYNAEYADKSDNNKIIYYIRIQPVTKQQRYRIGSKAYLKTRYKNTHNLADRKTDNAVN